MLRMFSFVPTLPTSTFIVESSEGKLHVESVESDSFYSSSMFPFLSLPADISSYTVAVASGSRLFPL